MDGLLLLLKMHRKHSTLLTTDLVREAVLRPPAGSQRSISNQNSRLTIAADHRSKKIILISEKMSSNPGI
jgi:hypothetical protein